MTNGELSTLKNHSDELHVQLKDEKESKTVEESYKATNSNLEKTLRKLEKMSEEKDIEIAQQNARLKNVVDLLLDASQIFNTVESNVIRISDAYVKLEAENEDLQDNKIASSKNN